MLVDQMNYRLKYLIALVSIIKKLLKWNRSVVKEEFHTKNEDFGGLKIKNTLKMSKNKTNMLRDGWQFLVSE